MGGISVILLLGVFSALYYFILAIIIYFSVSFLVTYIFDSLTIYNRFKQKRAFIPFLNKYYLGKAINNQALGIFLFIFSLIAVISLIGIISGLFFNFYLFILSLLIYDILYVVVLALYSKKYCHYSVIITIFSILSLGLLGSIGCFFNDNNITRGSK